MSLRFHKDRRKTQEEGASATCEWFELKQEFSKNIRDKQLGKSIQVGCVFFHKPQNQRLSFPQL